MATTSVTSGQTVSDISVTSGNTYNIAAGGIVNGASVLRGGVISGDSAALYSGTITDAGTISGGILLGSGTTEVVSSGAVLANQTIGSGASATLLANTSAARNIIISGGTIDLYTNNTSNTTIVGTGGNFILESGVTFNATSGNYATSGNTITVNSGAVLSGSRISSGGVINVNGGVISSTVVDGGTLNVNKATSGTNNTTFTSNGGTVNLESGFADTRSWTISNNVTFNVLSGAKISDSFVQSGGLLDVSTGGSVNGTATISSGGTIDIPVISSGAKVVLQSGSIMSGLATVASAGVLSAASSYVYSGTITNYGAVYGGTLAGSAQLIASGSGANSLTSGVSIESGGRLYLGSGATGSANLVNGGTLEIASGATPSNNRFGSGTGGTIIIDSGATWSNANSAAYNVTSGNTLVIQSGGTVSGTVIATGGTTVISSGGILAGTQTVSSGGTLVLNGTAGTGAVLLSGDGANLVISGTTMPTNTISGWSPKDTIDLASIPAASVTSVTTTSTGITFYTSGGTYSLKVPGASSYGYTLSSDSNGGLIYTTCFAEGTSLMTPDGEATVETLVPGTLVMTPKGAMPVKWLGHRSITVADQRVPEENWLVRIREGALADGVPSRDLLVTQEHCMVFEGKLVPARMLVNGASILIDRTINSYTYYHVELESHEAVWAENALTESYLDTGNRSQFDNHTVTAIFGGSKAGGSETLPLETSRAFVEPIHAAIAARAASAVTQPELTTDPDLHLVTNFGQIIRPLRQANDRVMFMIPANVESVSLVSRTSRPSDTIGSFVDDRRSLGVLVGDVSLFASRKTVRLTAHLSMSHLSGWHELESSRYRWTDGNAALSLRDGSTLGKNPSLLSVQIVSSGPYLMEAPAIQTELRQVG